MLQYLLSNYGWLLGAGGVVAGGLAWVLGVPSLLRILASVVDVLSPILKAIIEKLVEGVKDILDNMATILTVAVLCYGVHLYDKAQYIPKHNHVVTQLSVCQAEVKRITKNSVPQIEPELWEFPFKWPF